MCKLLLNLEMQGSGLPCSGALLAGSPIFNKSMPVSKQMSPVTASSERHEDMNESLPKFSNLSLCLLKVGQGSQPSGASEIDV